MSTTRRAPKRKRVQRRIENEQLRTARRDSLSILLSRAQRGVLSRDEAALLRTHVEAELADADNARRSERGQQRAMDRERRRVEAAEQAIAELERDLADAEAALAALSARDGMAAVAVDYRNRARRYRAAWQSAATRARRRTDLLPLPPFVDHGQCQ